VISVDNLLVFVDQNGHILRDKTVLLGDGVRICQGNFLHLVEGVLLGALCLRELDTKKMFWLQCSFQNMLVLHVSLLGYANCSTVVCWTGVP